MFSILGLGFLLVAGVFAGAVFMALRGSAQLDLARVVGDASGAIAKAPVLFGGLALVGAGLPNAALFVSMAAGPASFDFGSALTLGVVGGLVAFAWYQFFLLAMVAAALEALGGSPRPRGVIAAALPILPQAMLTSVLYWLAVGIGFSFFVVPGVILACVWMLVPPALVASAYRQIVTTREGPRRHELEAIFA